MGGDGGVVEDAGGQVAQGAGGVLDVDHAVAGAQPGQLVLDEGLDALAQGADEGVHSAGEPGAVEGLGLPGDDVAGGAHLRGLGLGDGALDGGQVDERDAGQAPDRLLDVAPQRQVEHDQGPPCGSGAPPASLDARGGLGGAVGRGRFGAAAQPEGCGDELAGQDGRAQAAAGDDEVCQGQGAGQLGVGHGPQAAAGGESPGAVGARVDPDVARAALVQGGDGGAGVGAGPHEQDPAGAQRRQEVGGQVEADGDDAAAGAGEPRGAGDPAGGGRGVGQGAVELGGQRPLGAGDRRGAAQLAGDLPLAHDHGLQPGGGGEELGDGVRAAPGGGDEGAGGGGPGGAGVEEGGHGAGERGRARVDGPVVEHEGEAVAGGQDDGSAHAGHRAQQVGAQARGDGTQAGDGVEPVGAVVYGEQMNHGSPY